MASGMMRRGVLGFLAAAILAACASTPAETSAPETALEPAYARIFLVRHGEKEAGDDPVLSAAGAARADALAVRLAAEGVTEIWSTQTNRTQQTAAPLAAKTGLSLQPYDARALPAFASWLKASPGVKLVVGHSNTTDALAGLLGADPGPAIAEATEFDRLYVIELGEQDVTSSRIERYGAASVIAPE